MNSSKDAVQDIEASLSQYKVTLTEKQKELKQGHEMVETKKKLADDMSRGIEVYFFLILGMYQGRNSSEMSS